jgi:hypothetical protein
VDFDRTVAIRRYRASAGHGQYLAIGRKCKSAGLAERNGEGDAFPAGCRFPNHDFGGASRISQADECQALAVRRVCKGWVARLLQDRRWRMSKAPEVGPLEAAQIVPVGLRALAFEQAEEAGPGLGL